MNIKLIKNEKEYEDALAEVEQLLKAEPGSPEADRLEVLSVLIEKYEEDYYPMEMPDPITAIKFRMEQQGLKQKDLVPYIGSQSHVSAVLNGKRELSKEMIRQLHQGLGISYEVLIQKPGQEYEEKQFDSKDFPFNDMVHQGYFPGYSNVRQAKLIAERLLDNLYSVFNGDMPTPIYCRHAQQEVDEHALVAWQAYVLNQIEGEMLPDFDPDQLDDDFFRELLRLSLYESGVLLVKEHLNKNGIHFVIAEHLPKTYLDGASFISRRGAPVVAMTLRYDRLDNFWFTLFHELAHVKLHLTQDAHQVFFDNTIKESDEDCDPHEQEANQYTWQLMIPEDYWREHVLPVIDGLSEGDINAIAQDLKINPAIIAGRIRYQLREYTRFSDLIGHKKVRHHLIQSQVAR